MSAPVAMALAALSAWGQVNAESLAAIARPTGLGAEIGFRGALVGGNLEMLDASGQAALHWRSTSDPEGRWLRDRVLLLARGAYRSLFGQALLDQRLLHARHTHMFRRRIGLDVFAQLNNDLIRRIRARWVAGVGPSSVLASRDGLEIWVGVAAMAELELRSVPPEGPDPVRVLNPRASAYASWTAEIVPERLSWTQNVYVQPRLDAPADVQWLVDGVLRVPITPVLSQTTALVVRGDTRPPTEVGPIDFVVSVGFDLRWAAAGSVPAPP